MKTNIFSTVMNLSWILRKKKEENAQKPLITCHEMIP